MELKFPARRVKPPYEQLAQEQEKSLYLTCLHLTGDPQDAQDCAQEALLKGWRHYASFRGDAQPATWLHRIAVNVCMDLMRKRRKNASLEQLQDDGFEPADRGAEVYLALDEKERRALLRQGLERLSPDARAVVALRDLEGCSIQETAELLSLPEGTVKSRLTRARRQLCSFFSAQRELFEDLSV